MQTRNCLPSPEFNKLRTLKDIIKLIKLYRLTAGLAERLRLADEILRAVEPGLRLFVFKAIQPSVAEDVLQESMKAIALNLKKFQGASKDEFWGWCYRITRNRLNDQYRIQASNRLDHIPHDDLAELVEAYPRTKPLSPGDRLDLNYALDLLTTSKPECRDLLLKHFVLGLGYGEIAAELSLSYDSARMRIGRCLDEARNLVS